MVLQEYSKVNIATYVNLIIMQYIDIPDHTVLYLVIFLCCVGLILGHSCCVARAGLPL